MSGYLITRPSSTMTMIIEPLVWPLPLRKQPYHPLHNTIDMPPRFV